MQTLSWRAYAKVNLCLSVGAPEPEGSPKAGWHAIATWMQCIDLFDEVVIQKLEEDSPSRASVRWAADAIRPTQVDWPIEKDLAFRALKGLEAHFARPLPISVEVVKRIPVGGGLGGGSADAAAVLLGVPRLLGLEISDEDLMRLAMSLGSDVAFFADSDAGPETPAAAALVGGFGDEIERVQSAASELLLVIPAYGCATAPVYKQFDAVLKETLREESLDRARRGLTGPEKGHGPKMGMAEARWQRAGQTGRVEGDKLFNDLAIPAYRVEPRLGQLVTALARATRETPCVTGSGSCVFFPVSIGKADKLQERVERFIASVDSEPFGSGARVVRTRLA